MSQLIPPRTPFMPTAPALYDRRMINSLLNTLRLYFTQIDQVLSQLLLGFNNFGSFYDTTTHTIAVANTAYAVTFNTTREAFGVALDVVTSRIVVPRGGLYRLQYTVQLDTSAAATCYVWMRVNGTTDITASASKTTLTSAANETSVTRVHEMTLVAGDYVELMWSADSTNATMPAIAASSPVPAVPSAAAYVTYLCPSGATQ